MIALLAMYMSTVSIANADVYDVAPNYSFPYHEKINGPSFYTDSNGDQWFSTSTTLRSRIISYSKNPGLDNDGDGFTNLQEVLCGVSQFNANDTPERLNLALSLAPKKYKFQGPAGHSQELKGDYYVDTDGDGSKDIIEIFYGNDPFDDQSYPVANASLTIVDGDTTQRDDLSDIG